MHWAWWIVVAVMLAIFVGVVGILGVVVFRLARAIPGRAGGLKVRLYLLIVAFCIVGFMVLLATPYPVGSLPRGSIANVLAILVAGVVVAATTGRREGRFHPLAITGLTFTAAFAYVAAWGQNHFMENVWWVPWPDWLARSAPLPFVDTRYDLVPAILLGALAVVSGIVSLGLLLTRRRGDRGRLFALCAVVIPPCFGWTLYEGIWRPTVTPPEHADRLTLPRSSMAHDIRPDPGPAWPVLHLFANGGVGSEEGSLIGPETPPDDARLLVFLREAAARMRARPLHPDSPDSPLVPDDPILIQADEAAPLARVLDVLAACQEAGIWRILLGARSDLDWAPGWEAVVNLHLPLTSAPAEIPAHPSVEIRVAGEGTPGELEYALGDRVTQSIAELRGWVLGEFDPEFDLTLSAGPGVTLADGVRLLEGLRDANNHFSGLLIPQSQP